MTPEQIQQLKAPLDRGRISTRKQGGTELSYLEGWDDIAMATEFSATTNGTANWSN